MKQLLIDLFADGIFITYTITLLLGAAVFLGCLTFMDWVTDLIKRGKR